MKGINMGENGKKSIFKKVLWSMGAVMTGAILIIEISSLLLIHKDGQRAQELFEDTIDSYGVFWENKLNETSRMMLSFISAETGALYSQLCNSEDKLTVETAKLQLRSQIADMNARQGYELVTFVYVPDRNIYFSVDEKNTSYLKSQGIKENVFDYIAHNTIASKDKWSVLYVQDTPYLLNKSCSSVSLSYFLLSLLSPPAISHGRAIHVSVPWRSRMLLSSPPIPLCI